MSVMAADKQTRLRRADVALGITFRGFGRAARAGLQVPGLSAQGSRYARWLAGYIAVWGHEPSPSGWSGPQLAEAERELVRARVRRDLIRAGFAIHDVHGS
jgi:hypothetical protein